MGIIIEKFATGREHKHHTVDTDHFSLDASGRLVPRQGEVFETMPLGSLFVVAFTSAGNLYQQNPHTADKMRWEVGFSQSRVSFFSPDVSSMFGGVATKSNEVTQGFYDYTDLRSISLGSANEPGGPYVSMVFAIRTIRIGQIPTGVRVHGSTENLHAFATMLSARMLESYKKMDSLVGLDTKELEQFFVEVNGFDFYQGEQTDYFISAEKNVIHITQQRPNRPFF